MDLWDLCCYSVSVLYVIELSDLHYSVLNPQKKEKDRIAQQQIDQQQMELKQLKNQRLACRQKIKNRSNRHKKELSLLRKSIN